MSTLTSTDFGELKRPTTRVHAPPGGGSSWSFGDDSAPAPTGRKRFNQQQQEQQQPDASMESPPPAPAQIQTQTLTQTQAAGAQPVGALRVALLKTSSDAEIVDAAAQNCLAKLQAQVEAVIAETFTVASLEQLPYAANKLTELGGFDGVICFAL
ncbi:hypothetical protein ON010_g8041 [Phytophthora cinnamomi]|nr:hypothetical protein ON010_g8041 [Phytophthora cinnamomi]